MLPVSGPSPLKKMQSYTAANVFLDLKIPHGNLFYIITAIKHCGLSPYTHFPVNMTTCK